MGHDLVMVKNPPAMHETWIRSLGWEDPQRRERLPTPVFWPGEFHRLWGRRESDTAELLSLSRHFPPDSTFTHIFSLFQFLQILNFPCLAGMAEQ